MRIPITATVVSAALMLVPGTAAASSSCVNATAPAGLKSALTKLHHRGGAKDGPIAAGSLYYGRCGNTQYAIASFSKALADQPEKFRRLPGRGWVDIGDGFEDGCSASARRPIPWALVKLWGTCMQRS
ncbi:MAG: hypothetical protein V9E83_10040 [Baekduia sp.]